MKEVRSFLLTINVPATHECRDPDAYALAYATSELVGGCHAGVYVLGILEAKAAGPVRLIPEAQGGGYFEARVVAWVAPRHPGEVVVVRVTASQPIVVGAIDDDDGRALAPFHWDTVPEAALRAPEPGSLIPAVVAMPGVYPNRREAVVLVRILRPRPPPTWLVRSGGGVDADAELAADAARRALVAARELVAALSPAAQTALGQARRVYDWPVLPPGDRRELAPEAGPAAGPAAGPKKPRGRARGRAQPVAPKLSPGDGAGLELWRAIPGGEAVGAIAVVPAEGMEAGAALSEPAARALSLAHAAAWLAGLVRIGTAFADPAVFARHAWLFETVGAR